MTVYNTVYAPNDDIMDQFFSDYWAQYYPQGSTIDKVNIKPLYALLADQIEGSNISVMTDGGKEQIYGSSPVFLSKIRDGKARTLLTNTPVDAEKIDNSIYCSNGILYEVNSLMAVPRYFSFVTAPAFLDPAYNMFLLLMYKAGFDRYTSKNVTFYAFYPDDAIIKETQTFDGYSLIYSKNITKAADEDVCYEDGEATVSVGASFASNIVRNHFCDNVIEVRGTDEKIYHTTYGTFNYLYQKDNKIYSSLLYNEVFGVINQDQKYQEKEILCEEMNDLPENVKIENGHVYRLKGGPRASAFLTPPSSSKDNRFIQDNEGTYSIDPRSNLIPKDLKGTFVSTLFGNQDEEVLKAMQEESVGGKLPRFILFASTNNGIEAALDNGIFSYGDAKQQAAYVSNLFVSVPRSRLADYPFPGDGQGVRELQTFKKKTAADGGGYTSIKIRDDGSHLTVIDPTGREVKVKYSFPYIYSDGAIYVLDGYLDFGEYNTKENIN